MQHSRVTPDLQSPAGRTWGCRGANTFLPAAELNKFLCCQSDCVRPNTQDKCISFLKQLLFMAPLKSTQFFCLSFIICLSSSSTVELSHSNWVIIDSFISGRAHVHPSPVYLPKVFWLANHACRLVVCKQAGADGRRTIWFVCLSTRHWLKVCYYISQKHTTPTH